MVYLLTIPCYLTHLITSNSRVCSHVTPVYLLTTPCYLTHLITCNMSHVTPVCLLTTPCYLTLLITCNSWVCLYMTPVYLVTTPCYLTHLITCNSCVCSYMTPVSGSWYEIPCDVITMFTLMFASFLFSFTMFESTKSTNISPRQFDIKDQGHQND